MVSFGDLKHELVKPLQSLLDVTPLKLALSAKCTIHYVMLSPFYYYIISFSLSFNWFKFSNVFSLVLNVLK